jgi:hypothetical protein
MPYLKDPRKGDRHKPDRKSRSERAEAYFAERFTAVDGEGIGRPQVYAYLADSDGREIWDPRGLSTVRCLDFLCAIPQGRVVVAFGLGYDVEMWLKDVPKEIRRLINHPRGKKPVRWGQFRFRYWPKKRFEVWRCSNGAKDGYCRIDDVYSNFGAKFEDVAKEWCEGTNETVLSEGKARRGSFVADDLSYIRRYTAEELRLLVQAVGKLTRARIAAGFYSTDLYSPANLSTERLRKIGFARFKTTLPAEMADAAYRAFHGGRIEVVAYGTRDAPVWESDLSSAYPSALTWIPDLSGEFWVHDTTDARHDASPAVLYHARWHFPDDWRICPFPFRKPSGGTVYPRWGEAWLWGAEVTPAFDPRYVTILESWYFTAERTVWDERHRKRVGGPFAPLAEDYLKRAELKKAGDPAQKALKTSLAAVYGKLAQKVSATGGVPRFHDIVYAGILTALTRSRLWTRAKENPSAVLSFNTDAVYTSEAPADAGVGLGERLGEWKVARFDGIQTLRSGLYRLRKDGAWVKPASRGFAEGEVPWDLIVSGWKEGKERVRTVGKERFVSFAFADHRARLELAGTWEKPSKNVTLTAAGTKRADLPNWRGVNPATSLRWTEPEDLRITEFDLSAPKLPAWLSSPRTSQRKPVSRGRGRRVLPAPAEASEREVSAAPRHRKGRMCRDDRTEPIAPLAPSNLGTAPSNQEPATARPLAVHGDRIPTVEAPLAESPPLLAT